MSAPARWVVGGGAGVLGAVLLCVAGSPAIAQTVVLRGGVVGAGATPVTGLSGSGVVMVGTVGQAAIGRSVDLNSNVCLGFWCFGGVRVVAIEEDPIEDGLPTAIALGPPSPNPTSGRVTFALALPAAADVRVHVIDVEGRMVGSMHAGHLDAGRYRLEWDGTDGNGRVSAAGVYFARLFVDGRPIGQRRIVRLR